MSYVDELTKDQKKTMIETRDEWINLFFDNVKYQKGINKPLFEEGIKWLYKDLLKKSYPQIVYCDSWLSCLITIEMLKNKINRDSVGASGWASVEASVRTSVEASVGDSVWASVEASVRTSVEASVWASGWASVGASVRFYVGDYSNYISISNYGWVSFYDFFEKIKVIDNFNFKRYKNLIKSGVFNAYEYENYVFAIQPPICLEINESGRLHSTSTAAVKFKDGSQYYFINGRPIPSWVIEKKDTITKEMFISETNTDIRGAIYEVFGQKGMIDLLGAESIDIREINHLNGDVETVELLRTKDTFEEFGNLPLVWVKMICPSTGTTYLQGVDPHHTNAIEAIASLSPFKKEEYKFNLRS